MKLSKPAISRLLQIVRFLEQQKNEVVTSSVLENVTGYPSHTIRKDFSLLKGDFSTTNGYQCAALVKTIREALGLNAECRCCVVGLGRLGSAFLSYEGLKNTKFEILAGFDSNVNRIEILQSDFPLYPTFKMKDVIPRLKIEYALLCVPPEKAQAAAEKVIECGIVGIVNYAPVMLQVPANVLVENVYVADALSALVATRNITE